MSAAGGDGARGAVLRRRALADALLATALAPRGAARAQAPRPGPVGWWDDLHLFQVRLRDGGRLTIGLTRAEADALGGEGWPHERVARRLAEGGTLTAWRYETTGGPNNDRRYAPAGRVTVRGEAVERVEPYMPARVVEPPPERPG